MTRADLDEVLEQVLGEGIEEPARIPCLFRDASLLGLVGEEQQFSGEEYGRAVDQRSFEIVRRFRTRDFAAAVVRLKGRQVGTLGSIVPTGRSFEALGHVLISEKPAGAIVQSGLAGHLTASGIRLESSSRSGVARVRAHGRGRTR